jgi:hypothetical protein
MGEAVFGRIRGFGIALRAEVGDAKRELRKVGIDLDTYKITITEVQVRPLAPGFDFDCDDPSRLLSEAKRSLGLPDPPKPKLTPMRQCKESDDGYVYDAKLWRGMNMGPARRGLALDNVHTAMGRFVASNSKGKSFRQIGKGRALHLIIGLNGKCNVHLDSHGFVTGNDGHSSEVDFNSMLEHGFFDLVPDFLPGLYGTWGTTGFIAPMAKPEKDPDGHTKFVIGFFGTF